MNPKQQYILARDTIDMIRDYSNNADILEYADSLCFSIARILEDKSVVAWDDISGMCDQVWYAMKQGDAVEIDRNKLDALYDEYNKKIEAA